MFESVTFDCTYSETRESRDQSRVIRHVGSNAKALSHTVDLINKSSSYLYLLDIDKNLALVPELVSDPRQF